MSLNIPVIYGSVRSARLGIRLARFMVDQLKKRGHQAVLVDQVNFSLPMLDKRHFEYEAGTAPEDMEKLAKIFEEADAYLIVSGEYNHSVQPSLKNIIDHFYRGFAGRISAAVTYSSGDFGGVRAESEIRNIMGTVGAPCIQSIMPVSRIEEAFDEEGKPLDEKYLKRAAKLIDELEWYAEALKKARK